MLKANAHNAEGAAMCPCRPVFAITLIATALLAPGASHAAGVSGQGTWETTLQPRDLNGDGSVDAFYDTVLKLSWMADANVAGLMNWADAQAWAANLDLHGTTDWRLPTMIDTGAPGCDWSWWGTDCGYNVQTISQDGQTIFSEMAHLYDVGLGNKAYHDPSGDPNWGLTNNGGFRNFQPWGYWYGLAYAPAPALGAWHFNTAYGGQSYFDQVDEIYAVAVHPGDVVAAVPEPQTFGLLLMGLAVALVAARRRSI